MGQDIAMQDIGLGVLSLSPLVGVHQIPGSRDTLSVPRKGL